MTLRAPIALAAALLTASCAASLMKLPAGPGVPAPDAAEALDQATVTCQRIRTLSAELSVSGKIGGQGMRGRLLAGLAAPARRVPRSARAVRSAGLHLSASGDDATLLLPRDRRVLEHGRPADVLEAIAGVPLGPADLRATLTGCADAGDQARTAAHRRCVASSSRARAISTCIAARPPIPGGSSRSSIAAPDARGAPTTATS